MALCVSPRDSVSLCLCCWSASRPDFPPLSRENTLRDDDRMESDRRRRGVLVSASPVPARDPSIAAVAPLAADCCCCCCCCCCCWVRAKGRRRRAAGRTSVGLTARGLGNRCFGAVSLMSLPPPAPFSSAFFPSSFSPSLLLLLLVLLLLLLLHAPMLVEAAAAAARADLLVSPRCPPSGDSIIGLGGAATFGGEGRGDPRARMVRVLLMRRGRLGDCVAPSAASPLSPECSAGAEWLAWRAWGPSACRRRSCASLRAESSSCRRFGPPRLSWGRWRMLSSSMGTLPALTSALG